MARRLLAALRHGAARVLPAGLVPTACGDVARPRSSVRRAGRDGPPRIPGGPSAAAPCALDRGGRADCHSELSAGGRDPNGWLAALTKQHRACSRVELSGRSASGPQCPTLAAGNGLARYRSRHAPTGFSGIAAPFERPRGMASVRSDRQPRRPSDNGVPTAGQSGAGRSRTATRCSLPCKWYGLTTRRTTRLGLDLRRTDRQGDLVAGAKAPKTLRSAA